jgi:DNA-binding transcriptional ArsR family regulator
LRGARAAPGPAAAAGVDRNAVATAAGTDELLHHRIRLGIVSALAGTSSLTFVELRALLATTDGNLSVHARKLEEARYISCTKYFAERRPQSEYRIETQGRRALERYLDHMQAVIEAARTELSRR